MRAVVELDVHPVTGNILGFFDSQIHKRYLILRVMISG